MGEILTTEDNFVIVRGIAGIGKSTMVETFVLKWAKSQLLTGVRDSPNIKFLFRITCREVNVRSNVTNSEELLQRFFPTVFNRISIMDLNEISNNVLIMVDGIDELKDVHKLNNAFGSHRTIYDLLDVNCHILSGHKTIVSGQTTRLQNC